MCSVQLWHFDDQCAKVFGVVYRVAHCSALLSLVLPHYHTAQCGGSCRVCLRPNSPGCLLRHLRSKKIKNLLQNIGVESNMEWMGQNSQHSCYALHREPKQGRQTESFYQILTENRSSGILASLEVSRQVEVLNFFFKNWKSSEVNSRKDGVIILIHLKYIQSLYFLPP